MKVFFTGLIFALGAYFSASTALATPKVINATLDIDEVCKFHSVTSSEVPLTFVGTGSGVGADDEVYSLPHAVEYNCNASGYELTYAKATPASGTELSYDLFEIKTSAACSATIATSPTKSLDLTAAHEAVNTAVGTPKVCLQLSSDHVAGTYKAAFTLTIQKASAGGS